MRDGAQALVNPVNTAGVMGKGLALQFKRAFPANFTAYAEACADGRLGPGKVLAVPLDGDRWVINFPTKRHWRSASRLEDIESGLSDLSRVLSELDVTSVAVPPLGCGHGGLAWDAVHPLIAEWLGPLGLEVLLYVPEGRSTEGI
ncbi:macro domain-containing protein [Actinomadura sp. BRA 177]|uniref:macro domain-containing protein n=1 Tax=Actinomadura sp. BRA 177 TaxID=2745202 RepID=UPI0020CCABE5|nr:macro domain-containing protein [Actinomadura sp. BRA 177]